MHAHLQGHMQALQQQLDAVSSTAESASEATLGAAAGSLQTLKGLHTSYASSASQVGLSDNAPHAHLHTCVSFHFHCNGQHTPHFQIILNTNRIPTTPFGPEIF